MKTKKIFASVLAAASLCVCMAAGTVNGALHSNWSVRYCKDTSFTDSSDSNRNVNKCSYTSRVKTACYYQATVSLKAKQNNYNNPICHISGESNGGWTYFNSGRGSISSNVKMTTSWSWTPIYNKIDYETNNLCSRLTIKG